MKIPSLRILALAAVAVLGIAYAMVFFYAPNDADQGFIQKIFYLHVPIAICTLVAFIVAAIHAIRHVRTGESIHDLRSYVCIHIGIIFGLTALLTGSIWAKAAWGKWWVWDEPTLVSFLIVFLLYCTYYPLRYAIEDRRRQARYASVFAITAGAFVPLNFAAVRMAESLVHPRVLGTTEGGMPGSMLLTFTIALIGMALLYTTLVRFEITAKLTSGRIARLRRALDADAPAGPSSRIAPAQTTGA